MSKYNIMDDISRRNNGYLTTSLVQEAGISRTYMGRYVKEKGYERVGNGIYISPETWPDPFFILQLKNEGVVFSHETALYLHGLMEREPNRIYVSVRRGYNASRLIEQGIKPYFVRRELHSEGVSKVKTPYSNNVKLYDADRTICDIVIRKNDIDIQVFRHAMREYMSGSKKNLQRLFLYADMLGIEKKIREYTEVMI